MYQGVTPNQQPNNQPQNLIQGVNYYNAVRIDNQIPVSAYYSAPSSNQQNTTGLNQKTNLQIKTKQNKGRLENPMNINQLQTIVETRNQEETNKNSSAKIDKMKKQQNKEQKIRTDAYASGKNLTTPAFKQQLFKNQSIQSSQTLIKHEDMKNISSDNAESRGITPGSAQQNMLSSSSHLKQSIPSGQIKTYGPNKVLGPICQFCYEQAGIKQKKIYGEAFMGWTILLCLTSPCLVWIPYCYEPCYDKEMKCSKCRRVRNVIRSKWGCGY